jgi:hypothetical protein
MIAREVCARPQAGGVSPAAVLGQAAYLTGLMETCRNLQPRDVAGLFEPS